MSSAGELVQEEARQIRRARLEAAGLSEQYDLWREALPPDTPDGEAYNLFLQSQATEEAAQQGRLSVTTGGEEGVPDIEVPTPGPGDEEGGPGEAGDTSEGEGDGPGLSDLIAPPDDPTALKLIEGMWVPPEEAVNENYEEPSTYDMSRSEDWIKNARILYDFMNPVQTLQERQMEAFMARSPITRPEAEPLSDDEVGEWARNELSGFNWNVMNTMQYAAKLTSEDIDPKIALAFLNLSNMYDHSDGSMMDFAGALGEIATDPTTYLGLGAGSVVAKGATKTVAKTGLKKWLQGAIIGGTAGAIEGGMLAGGFDLTVQNIEQEAGAREDIDYGRAGIATGMGVTLGTLLGGAGGAWAGRRADQLIKAIKEYKGQIKARDVFLDEGAMKEMGQKELAETLETLIMHQDKGVTKLGYGEGGSDLAARMAAAILDETGSMPRLKDGSIDYKKIYSIIDEMAEAQAMKGLGVTGAKYTIAATADNKLAETEAIKIAQELGIDMSRTVDNEGKVVHEFATPAEAEKFAQMWERRLGVNITKWEAGDVALDESWGLYKNDKLVDIAPTEKEASDLIQGDGEWFVQQMPAIEDLPRAQRTEWLDDARRAGMFDPETAQPDMTGRRAADPDAANEPFRADISDPESQKLSQKILEMEELEAGDVVLRTEGRPGSRVMDKMGEMHEIVGRTKNGWYKMRDKLGRERSMRRKDFEVIDKAPAPRKAGPMELDPFSSTAAKIIEMNERVLTEPNRLTPVTTTHAEQAKLADELEEMGIDITRKPAESYWQPHELKFLRDTYNRQATGIMDMAVAMRSKLRNEGRLLDSELAKFNNAHSMFVTTRDLFYGVSGNAARQLNILKSKPTGGTYDFSQQLMDSIGIQGGRANTERAIGLMADFASHRHTRGTKGQVETLTNLSKSIWGNPTAAMLLNIRYNMMLSSWRTHAFNFIGNSASGVYQHLMVSPVKMGINNLQYARELAWSHLLKDAPERVKNRYGQAPDPADRLTRHQLVAEWRGHYAGARDSWMLAKEILMGRDIGEGKVWNELGLRYNVVNVPESKLGLTLTTPVRALEAGDAFFKNQYYNSKMHELSSMRARYDEIHLQKDYQERYQHYLDNPGELGGQAERTAREFAQKQTYTNDPNIYGGILSSLAESAAKLQNKHLTVNMIIPFVRTPANLLSYSMEMIGVQQALTPSKTYHAIMNGTAEQSQEAMARLTIAAGLWLVVAEMHQNGQITGTGPSNWEERKVWEAAGWQPNSIMVNGHWVAMDRAAPAGQSLSTIASVFDYYAMTQQQNKPAMEWVGAGLLYTADMILDESYLSTAMDVVTAISSKEEARIRSASSSMITSVFVPNFLRDLRRPADPQMRSTTSTNLLDQMHKQMMNATPEQLDLGQGSSTDLPPSRDWRGEPKNYFGNVYLRGLLPFEVRDPSMADDQSMALAYARVPVSQPNKTIAWPSGLGDAIDLFAMDNGQGFVYDEYVKYMGRNRDIAVTTLMETDYWESLVNAGQIGPGSDGDMALRRALGMGSKFGRLEMLNFLIEHSGENNTYKRMGPDGVEVPYLIQHPVSVDTYLNLREAVRTQGYELTEEEQQYIIKKPVEGPEFFKP